MLDESFVLEHCKSLQQNQCIIYEVNLSINRAAYEEHGAWFLQHIEDMVSLNGFSKAKIYHEVNMDPIDDSHMRIHNITVRYTIDSYDQLKQYLERNSKIMRSQVVEKFKNNYTTKRRVFVLDKEIVNK